MNFNLTGITKRSKTFHHHISYTWPDGKIRYVEMRREKVEKKQNLPEMHAQNKMYSITFCFIHRSNKNTIYRKQINLQRIQPMK